MEIPSTESDEKQGCANVSGGQSLNSTEIYIRQQLPRFLSRHRAHVEPSVYTATHFLCSKNSGDLTKAVSRT